MRIAILGPYPLDTQRLTGVEVAIAYLLRQLLQRGDLSVHVLTCSEALREQRIVHNGRLTVTYLPRHGLGRMTWHRREVVTLRRALVEIAPDIVHAHSTGLYAGAALGSPFPAVVSVHGIVSQEARLFRGLGNRLRGALDSAYERWVVRRAQHLMLITPYVETVFGDLFRGESYLVENACEERFFLLHPEPEAGRLFFAGAVIPRKGVLSLLRALALVRRAVPGAHARIAGSLDADPAYAAACQAYVRDADLQESVTFLGHIPQDQVLEEYRRCHVFVLPSLQETAPMVIEQAMAASVPSVGTAAGGVPWMLDDGFTGLVLPLPGADGAENGQAEARLADAITSLLDDPTRASEMGQAARAEAKRRFHPRQVAQRTVEVYERVIASAARLSSDARPR